MFPQKTPPQPAPSRPEATPPNAPPWLMRRNRPARRTSDAQGRRPHGIVKRGEPHPEAHGSRSRPIRSRIAAKSWRGTATSASWKMTYLACATTLAPIFTSFSRKVVRFQLRIDRGSANCHSEFARLYARANRCSRAALSLKRRHDSLVLFPAFFPFFTHFSFSPPYCLLCHNS